MQLKITKDSLKDTLSKSREQRWRSLERFLEKENREFEFLDWLGKVTNTVADEADAMQLGKRADLTEAELVAEDGTTKTLTFQKPKKPGRPRNMVYDERIGKGKTINQYTRELKANSISQSEITKSGILSKKELDTAIASGKVSVVNVGGSHRVDKKSLQAYIQDSSN